MLKIGLLGAGLIAKVHARMYHQINDVEVSALGLHRPEELAAIREIWPQIQSYTDPVAFLKSGIQVVDICLPTFLHKEYIEKSFQEGLDVICEKPLCRSVAEADAILEMMPRYAQHLYVAHVIRFWPEYRYLKNTIENGRLGALKSLYMGRYTGMPDWSINDWIVNQELSGGTPLDLQIHDLDFVLYTLGTPRNVSVRTRQNGLHIWTRYDYDPDLTVVMEAGNDMPGSFGFEMNFFAVFEKGLLRYNVNTKPTLTEYTVREKTTINLEEEGEEKLGRHVPTGDGYLAELTHFVDCIRRKVPSDYVTVESAVQTVKMILENQ